METEERRVAKAQLVTLMLQGQPWHAATEAAGLHVSRATVYRLLQRVRTEGEAALIEGRHGHATKLRAPLRDRQLTRDVRVVCERGEAAHPRVPDGRRWRFSLAGTGCQSIRWSILPSGVTPCE